MLQWILATKVIQTVLSRMIANGSLVRRDSKQSCMGGKRSAPKPWMTITYTLDSTWTQQSLVCMGGWWSGPNPWMTITYTLDMTLYMRVEITMWPLFPFHRDQFSNVCSRLHPSPSGLRHTSGDIHNGSTSSFTFSFKSNVIYSAMGRAQLKAMNVIQHTWDFPWGLEGVTGMAAMAEGRESQKMKSESPKMDSQKYWRHGVAKFGTWRHAIIFQMSHSVRHRSNSVRYVAMGIPTMESGDPKRPAFTVCPSIYSR